MKASRAARSMYVFGGYLALVGLVLIGAPHALLGPFGIARPNEVWVRVVGMLAILIAYYYLRMARAEQTAFFEVTVHARATVPLFFGAFVLLGWVEPSLILFGVVDLAGAVWTATALRMDRRSEGARAAT
jgi:hypothetical protein